MNRTTEIVFCLVIVLGFVVLVWPPADMGDCGWKVDDATACQHEAEFALRVLVGVPLWVLLICAVGYALEVGAKCLTS